MKVAYFDLGHSKEQYGIEATKYGGGGAMARYLKEDPEIDFHIFASQEAFKNLSASERVDRCHPLPDSVFNFIKSGYPLSEIIKGLEYFDIIVHAHVCESMNRGALKAPIVYYSWFDGTAGNPRNDYILLYDESFLPKFGEKAKYVTIGKPVPNSYLNVTKEDFVFQCSRHDDHMNSIELAQMCLRENIKAIFAGPIHGGYKLLDYIDNKNTIYLGEITESEKINLCNRCRLFSILYKWSPPFSLSIIEAQGQGAPIYVYNEGPFLSKYLNHGINGFDAKKISLREAFDQAVNFELNTNSWKSARKYDASIMVRSFKKAFTEIKQEWYK